MITPVKADNYPVIKGILEAPNERRTVEFKPSLPWPKRIDDSRLGRKIQEIIRSILAMSNIQDPSKIILGVQKDNQGNYVAEGMFKKHLKTYDSDIIYDVIRNFGTPEPKFEVLNIDFNNNFFIIFEIQPFVSTPIICRNKKPNIKKLGDATIYIRTYKPESKKITDSSEMRELINLAVDKELNSFSSRMGNLFKSMSKVHVTRTADTQKFKKQRGDI